MEKEISNKKISIDELAENVAKKNDITTEEAKRLINELFNLIGDNLKKDDVVKINNFGNFKKVWVDDREGINPQTKEKITIKKHYKVVFKPSSKLKNEVNKKYRHLTPNVIDELLTLTGMTKVQPEYTQIINKDKNLKDRWEKAKKRAKLLLLIFIILFLLLLATLITIPVVMYNQNNAIVNYVNRINKIFGLNKITDAITANFNKQEAEIFFNEAKEKLSQNRKIIDRYKIKKGDNIYNISKKYYENEYLWPDLYILNQKNFNDPDLIFEGQELIIYEKLGDPEKFNSKQKKSIVESYIGIYRIYKAFGEEEIKKGNLEKGQKRITDARWTLYTAVRYDHNLLNKYKDAIYQDDIDYVKKLIEKFGYKPEKK